MKLLRSSFPQSLWTNTLELSAGLSKWFHSSIEHLSFQTLWRTDCCFIVSGALFFFFFIFIQMNIQRFSSGCYNIKYAKYVPTIYMYFWPFFNVFKFCPRFSMSECISFLFHSSFLSDSSVYITEAKWFFQHTTIVWKSMNACKLNTLTSIFSILCLCGMEPK